MPPRNTRTTRNTRNHPRQSRKRSYSALSGPEGTLTTPLWLDILPADVCEHIANILCKGTRTDTALYLAETTPKQHQAVLSALSGSIAVRLTKDSDMADFETRWAKLFNDNLVELSVRYSIFARVRRERVLLLNAPRLRRVFIADHAVYLDAIAYSASVKELTVTVAGYSSPRVLLDTLSTLELERLTLFCGGRVCRLSRRGGMDSKELAVSCPFLECLTLVCKCDGFMRRGSPALQLPWRFNDFCEVRLLPGCPGVEEKIVLL